MGQTALLDELTHLVKLHFIISKEFDYNEDFELSLNFPIVEEDSDKARMKQDTLSFAKDVIETITTLTGLESPLPGDIIKQVLNNYTFMDKEEIDVYVDAAEIEYKKQKSADGSGDGGFGFEDDTKLFEKAKARLTEEVYREAYFSSKRNRGMTEGTVNGKHYVTSMKVDRIKDIQYEILSVDGKNKKVKG